MLSSESEPKIFADIAPPSLTFSLWVGAKRSAAPSLDSRCSILCKLVPSSQFNRRISWTLER